jgi:molecular chaperone DnaK
MAEEAYKAAGGAPGAGSPGPEAEGQAGGQAGGAKKDDVVDAEFEEQK